MSRVGQKPISIDYMPWADLKEEFTVGPVSFWSFCRLAEKKIPDAQVRDDLTRFFEAFVDNAGQPVRTVVVCTCGDIAFRRFTEEETEIIRAAADCLTFAAIAAGSRNGVCAGNCSMAPPSADRFDLCARWVYPCNDGLTVETEGSLSGWPHGQYHIPRPLSTGGPFMGDYRRLLEGLGRTFAKDFPADVRQRLFRSLEWFRFAHTESTAVSWLHKVVMMVTAFEILMQFPPHGQTAFFAGQIDKKLRLDDSIITKRSDSGGKEWEACLAAWWAWDFYDLRSRIAHGNAVTGQDGRYHAWNHLVVADLVLLELVQRLLFDYDCLGKSFRDLPGKYVKAGVLSRPEDIDIERDVLPSFFGFGFDEVHQALGWITPRQQE